MDKINKPTEKLTVIKTGYYPGGKYYFYEGESGKLYEEMRWHGGTSHWGELKNYTKAKLL